MDKEMIAATPIGASPQAPGTALVDIEQRRAMSEVEGAIILAKRFPRDYVKARDRILVACQRPGLAKEALYSYARGGTEITGPSIRLAEALAQNWGNLQFGIRELDQRDGVSTIETFCWDQETNVKQLKTFQVKHERHTKKGSYKLDDPRDIYETIANQGARRLRACILGVIPGDIIDEAVAMCEDTMKSSADISQESLKKLIAAFETYGVTREQVEKRIQRRIDTITPAQFLNLRKVYNSLKDGMSSPGDWFESTAPAESLDATANLKEKLKGKKAEGGEYAPGLCPDKDPEETMTKAFCDACKSRLGCPVWTYGAGKPT